MFQNYVTTAIRNLFRHRLYSLINIGGLAVGFAATILILLFVRDELSYDDWLPNADNIWRMHSTFDLSGRDPFRTVRSSGRIFYSVPGNVPEAAQVTRLFQGDISVIRNKGAFRETATLVDPNFFDVFDLPLALGDRETALRNVSSVLLSESMALKYFGGGDPIGQTLTICCNGPEPADFLVTGVFRDLPDNSHMAFDFISLVDREAFRAYPFMTESWTSVNAYTYFTLEPGANIDDLHASLDALLAANVSLPEDMAVERLSDLYKLSFMRVSDIHLDAREQAGDIGDMRPLANRTTLYTLVAIAFLVLAIAAINFMNLATARATQRAREVSLRKVLGAGRRDLALQFLGEALLTTLVAGIIAIALAELSLPAYNAYLQRDLVLDFLADPGLSLRMLGAVLLIGLISGVYPALVLSGFRPAHILKANKSADPGGRGQLRRFLVVAQFAISIGLVVVTSIVFSQTNFVKQSDLGFARDNRIILRGVGQPGVRDQQQALVNELRRLPEISSVALSSDVPTDNFENNNDVRIQGREDQGALLLNIVGGDYEFLKTYGVEPVAGRLFSESFGADAIVPPAAEGASVQASTVINEAAARHLGFERPADALGAVLVSDLNEAENTHLTVIGVIPDIRFRSLHFGVQPTMYVVSPSRYQSLTIAYETGDTTGLIEDIGTIWARHAPEVPLSQQFLNEMIERQYVAEDRQGALFAIFAAIAIVIACLGLFGLAAFSAERRTKEIGLRKVMGARVRDIVRLLIAEFSRPVMAANLIAWPIAGYFMRDWLEGFERRLDFFDPLFLLTYFGGAGLLALLIAWATVAGHAYRVARANPVHALRYE